MRTGFRRAVATAALTVQAAALFTPRPPQVDTGGFPLDKLGHLLLFALATATVIWAGSPVWPTAIIMVVYSGASEVIQAVLFAERSGDAGDVLADLIGVAIGSVVGARWARRTVGEPSERPR